MNSDHLTPFTQKKHLGQVFLHDRNILDKILASSKPGPKETVLEIGPGEGVLTKELAPRVKQLIAIETDRRLVQKLREDFRGQNNVEIIHADFLRFDLNPLPKKLKVIGNLPYYISSEIIGRLLETPDLCRDIFCTVQFEFGKRLVASPGDKDYGAFSCFVQYHAAPKLLFKIKRTSFRPPPKVDSCFLWIGVPDQPRYALKDKELLFRIIREAFQQRRKTILNSLARIIPKETLPDILESLNISPQTRPERLHLKDFIRITEKFRGLDKR